MSSKYVNCVDFIRVSNVNSAFKSYKLSLCLLVKKIKLCKLVYGHLVCMCVEKWSYTLKKDFVILQFYWWLFSSTKHYC